MTHEQYVAHWRDVHAPLFASQPDVKRYVRRYVQDHRAIKRRVNASQHFRSFCAARRTLAGYEAIHMIRKGQASGSASAPGIGLLHRFILGLFAATS